MLWIRDHWSLNKHYSAVEAGSLIFQKKKLYLPGTYLFWFFELVEMKIFENWSKMENVSVTQNFAYRIFLMIFFLEVKDVRFGSGWTDPNANNWTKLFLTGLKKISLLQVKQGKCQIFRYFF